jgi:pleiotropic regulator 1
MSFWDWKTGHRFQSLDTTAQPGSLDAEAGIMSSTFDRSGLRLICGEADKTSKSQFRLDMLVFALLIHLSTVKIWKQDETATEESHPLEWKPTLARRKF